MIDFKKTKFLLSAIDLAHTPKLRKPEVALFGKSNVGKSTFLNFVTGGKLAFSSKKAGKTQFLNYFLIDDRYYLVDTPGYGFQQKGINKDKAFALLMEEYCLSKRMSGAVVLIDTRRGFDKDDEMLIVLLKEEGIPFALIFTKSDKATRKEKDAIINLLKNQSLPFAFSGERGEVYSCRTLLLSLFHKNQ